MQCKCGKTLFDEYIVDIDDSTQHSCKKEFLYKEINIMIYKCPKCSKYTKVKETIKHDRVIIKKSFTNFREVEKMGRSIK